MLPTCEMKQNDVLKSLLTTPAIVAAANLWNETERMKYNLIKSSMKGQKREPN